QSGGGQPPAHGTHLSAGPQSCSHGSHCLNPAGATCSAQGSPWSITTMNPLVSAPVEVDGAPVDVASGPPLPGPEVDGDGGSPCAAVVGSTVVAGAFVVEGTCPEVLPSSPGSP